MSACSSPALRLGSLCTSGRPQADAFVSKASAATFTPRLPMPSDAALHAAAADLAANNYAIVDDFTGDGTVVMALR